MKLSTITLQAMRGPFSLRGYFANGSHSGPVDFAPGCLERGKAYTRAQRRDRAGLLRDWRAVQP